MSPVSIVGILQRVMALGQDFWIFCVCCATRAVFAHGGGGGGGSLAAAVAAGGCCLLRSLAQAARR